MSALKARVDGLKHKVFSTVPTRSIITKFSWGIFLVCLLGFIALPHRTFHHSSEPDENALLLHSSYFYFGEHHIGVAQRHIRALAALESQPLASELKINYVRKELAALGIVSATQNFQLSYSHLQQLTNGTNVYGILRSPRGDGSEALVLSADWVGHSTNQSNSPGVGLMLGLADLFHTSRYWARDVIFVITEGGTLGHHAWLSAYHNHESLQPGIEGLSIRSGAIQQALGLDFSVGFESISALKLVYGGINGLLPNQDLLTTVVEASFNTPYDYFTVGDDAPPSLNDENGSSKLYWFCLKNLFSQLWYQTLGQVNSPQGLFRSYDIDASTIVAIRGQPSRVGLAHAAQVVEAAFRSFNNLLERLHHATRLYIMMTSTTFLPLAHYLPFILILALLPVLSGLLYLRRYSPLEETQEYLPSNKKSELFQDCEPPLPRLQWDLHSLTLYLTSLAWCLVVERVFWWMPIWYSSSSLLFLAGVSSPLIVSLVHPWVTPSQLQTSQIISVINLGLLGSFLASLNAGLSFSLSVLSLPFTLFLLPLADGKNHSSFLGIVISFLVQILSPPVLLVVALTICGNHMSVMENILAGEFLGMSGGSRSLINSMVWGVWPMVNLFAMNWCYSALSPKNLSAKPPSKQE